MSRNALIVVDMVNPYQHPDADRLADSVAGMIETLARLISRATEREDTELIFVNDNHGDFAAARDDIVRRAVEGERPDLVTPILPAPDRPFLPKVRHSAFYGTPLEYLLSRHGTEQLIIAGQVTEQCVLYSALDGYVRHFKIRVPQDAVAHIEPDLGAAALTMMRSNMRADIVDADACLDGG
ncbi:MAG: cysteine hydrolase family protein [Pseudonocardia sp.]